MRLAALLAVIVAAFATVIALAQDPGVNGRYTPDYWRLEKPAQQEATIAPEPAADAPKPASDTPKPWYQQNKSLTKCLQSPLSPAEFIRMLREGGVRTGWRGYGDQSNPSKLDAVAFGDDGSTETWTYWRSQDECERELPEN